MNLSMWRRCFSFFFLLFFFFIQFLFVFCDFEGSQFLTIGCSPWFSRNSNYERFSTKQKETKLDNTNPEQKFDERFAFAGCHTFNRWTWCETATTTSIIIEEEEELIRLNENRHKLKIEHVKLADRERGRKTRRRRGTNIYYQNAANYNRLLCSSI